MRGPNALPCRREGRVRRLPSRCIWAQLTSPFTMHSSFCTSMDCYGKPVSTRFHSFPKAHSKKSLMNHMFPPFPLVSMLFDLPPKELRGLASVFGRYPVRCRPPMGPSVALGHTGNSAPVNFRLVALGGRFIWRQSVDNGSFLEIGQPCNKKSLRYC